MRQLPRYGFTLVELVITLLLLAILVAMAAPSFVDTLDKRRVINATQSLSAQILQARSLAVTRNRNVSLVIDAPADSPEWCFGVTDGLSPDGEPPGPGVAPTCDCTLEDPDEDDACTVSVPSVADVSVLERTLIRAEETAFPGVNLVFVGTNLATPINPMTLTFEPTRGLASGTAVVEFISPRGRETRVAANRIGRVSTCSPSEETLLGGIKPCDD